MIISIGNAILTVGGSIYTLGSTILRYLMIRSSMQTNIKASAIFKIFFKVREDFRKIQ